VLYAAEDPIDIRALGPRFQRVHRPTGFQHLVRLWTAMKEYF
jgi:cell division protein FtsA